MTPYYFNSFLIGTLLGDAHLSLPNSSGCSRLNLKHQALDKNYIFHKFNLLKDYAPSYRIKNKQFPSYIETYDKRTNKIYYAYQWYTKQTKEFAALRTKWYPENKKIVPKDIYLNSIVLFYWYLDDGSISIKNNQIHMSLATDGFSKNDVVFLCDLLDDYFNKKNYFRAHLNSKNYRIQFCGDACKLFIEDIDKHFSNFMLRKAKWKLSPIDWSKLKRMRISNPAITDLEFNNAINYFKSLNRLFTNNEFAKFIKPNCDRNFYSVTQYRLNKFVKEQKVKVSGKRLCKKYYIL